jgi:hypothetical protein
MQQFDVGMGGPGYSGSLKVVGGTFGVVIDARGRPLQFSEDPYRHYEDFKKWVWMLNG